jgi:hypothetical protein
VRQEALLACAVRNGGFRRAARYKTFEPGIPERQAMELLVKQLDFIDNGT